ncbi:hypothetical protein GC163_15685 [bacterium]|nr:hypothetical protein [bacterium]
MFAKTSKPTLQRFPRIWNWMLLIVGVSVMSVSVGQWIVMQRRGGEDPTQELVLLVSAIGGGGVAVTGFSLIAATTPEHNQHGMTESGRNPRLQCSGCDTWNREMARFCDQCGNKLG